MSIILQPCPHLAPAHVPLLDAPAVNRFEMQFLRTELSSLFLFCHTAVKECWERYHEKCSVKCLHCQGEKGHGERERETTAGEREICNL